jgi:hypothetical protein
MKQLNTIPIENFLDKARIATKSGAKIITLDVNEAADLANCLAVVMTRLAGDLDNIIQTASQQTPDIDVKMDGGGF